MLYSDNNEHNFKKSCQEPMKMSIQEHQTFTKDYKQQRIPVCLKLHEEICNQLKIKQNPSIAYHPQTDGQTQRVNQEMEQYLQLYISYQQDNQAKWLSMAKFAHNNRQHSSTGKSPSFLNIERHPNIYREGEKSTGRVPEGKLYIWTTVVVFLLYCQVLVTTHLTIFQWSFDP